MTIEHPTTPGTLTSVYFAWAFALLAVIAIVTLVPVERQAAALGLSLGVTAVVAFVAQLVVAQKSGLVVRLALSLLGAFVIVGAATLIISLVAAS
jgi:hypothetical protein